MLSPAAITTKFIGPTNFRGSRVKASFPETFCGPDSRPVKRTMTVAWDHSLNSDQNHIAAARALAECYGHYGSWFAGDNGANYVFVRVPHESIIEAAFVTKPD